MPRQVGHSICDERVKQWDVEANCRRLEHIEKASEILVHETKINHDV